MARRFPKSIGSGRLAVCAALAAALAAPAVRAAEPGCVVATTQPVTTQYEAYARVEPVRLLPVRTAAAGEVAGLTLLPGATVKAGEEIARLGGAQVAALQASRERAVAQAEAALKTAQELLAIQQGQLASHLGTKEAVTKAAGAVSDATATLAAAQADRQALEQTLTLRAPADGVVVRIDASDGERVDAGQTVVTVQPATGLWLRAEYYGAAAGKITEGMTGSFVPADGGAAVPVKVAAVLGCLAADGGLSVGLVATKPGAGWRSGAFGTVTLEGETRDLVMVPTQALILDEGKWWVLVRTAQGAARRAVVPGPARGWETALEEGPAAGAQIVVDNAYLEFHRDVATHYQQPD